MSKPPCEEMKRAIALAQYARQRYLTKADYPRTLLLCMWCGNPLSDTKSKLFCSDECRHEVRFRSDTTYLRQTIEKRDNGVCAKCGTSKMEWNAHHVFPVNNGGGCCGPDNIETQCVKCHMNIDTKNIRARKDCITRVTLSISKDLYSILNKYANASNMSRSNAVVHLLMEQFKKMGVDDIEEIDNAD